MLSGSLALTAEPMPTTASPARVPMLPASNRFRLGACLNSRWIFGREHILSRLMSKFFRPWKIDEARLLPPSVQSYVPSGHLSRFILALVRESLNHSELVGSYRSDLGQPPFDPRMMTALLLTGYASGDCLPPRRIAKACEERAGFMMIVAGDAPDFRTVSEFRRRHLNALGGLFVQVLKLAEKAGLVKPDMLRSTGPRSRRTHPSTRR